MADERPGRRSTRTSSFGSSKREGHDASAFYGRFSPPEVSADDTVHPDKAIDKLIVGSSTAMDEVPDASVALVVTSPPYFAGKEYEEALGHEGIPATYLEYLDLLRAVFTECVRTLEPGGRIAVNVANLGRRPYRSLSADVIGILQDDLRLLLRGEIIWQKQRGSSGSCAWGSFQQPKNPVLRDLTERVIIASKGRFDRVHAPGQTTMSREAFMENTLDVWEIPAESARRVGHPAPFPVELPERLIHLYTYAGDLVLDPFLGSGTSAVAAVRTGRHYVGYDTDPAYVDLAERRVSEARDHVAATPAAKPQPAIVEGRAAKEIARAALRDAGFTDLAEKAKQPGGVEVTFASHDAAGQPWLFEVCGGFTSHRPGLQRADTLWKAIAKAAVLHQVRPDVNLVLLTTGEPAARSAPGKALTAVCGPGRPIHSVVSLLTATGAQRLAHCYRGDSEPEAQPRVETPPSTGIVAPVR